MYTLISIKNSLNYNTLISDTRQKPIQLKNARKSFNRKIVAYIFERDRLSSMPLFFDVVTKPTKLSQT